MIYRRNIFTLVVFAAGFCFYPTCVWADSVTDSAATQLYGTTMSPYCPGVTLSACTSEDARVLREEILASLNGGATIAQVRENLIGRYGRDVLGLPKTSGFGAVAWVLPPLVVLIGASCLFWFLRRSIPTSAVGSSGKSPTTANPADTTGVTADVRERIEREVRERLG